MSTAVTHASPAAARGSYLRARLASFFGIAPLGVWTVVHLWNNLAAMNGAAAWQSAVTEHPHPVAQAATMFVVLAPLALHTFWGIGRLFSSRPNNQRYGFFNNLRYALQRASAIGVLFFLGAHLWLAMLHPRLVEGHAEVFADITHEMHHHTPTLIVYVLGVLGVAYHLANGVSTFAMAWGLSTSRRSLRGMNVVSMVFLALLLGLGWGAVYVMYQAGA